MNEFSELTVLFCFIYCVFYDRPCNAVRLMVCKIRYISAFVSQNRMSKMQCRQNKARIVLHLKWTETWDQLFFF